MQLAPLHCKDKSCTGYVITTADSSKVCMACGLVLQERSIEPISYKTQETGNWQNKDQICYEENDIIYDFDRAYNIKKEDRRNFLRASKKAEEITTFSHQKRAKRTVLKTWDRIDNLVELQGLAGTQYELKNKCKIIINQIYNSWFASRQIIAFEDNTMFWETHSHLLNSTYNYQQFSIPKDSDIISATAIRLGAKFLRKIKGGLINKTIYNSIKGKQASEKFKMHVSRFYNSLKINNVIDYQLLGEHRLEDTTKNHYIITTTRFCNSLNFPIKITNAIVDIIKLCISHVWLGGKKPEEYHGYMYILCSLGHRNDDHGPKTQTFDRQSTLTIPNETPIYYNSKTLLNEA